MKNKSKICIITGVLVFMIGISTDNQALNVVGFILILIGIIIQSNRNIKNDFNLKDSFSLSSLSPISLSAINKMIKENKEMYGNISWRCKDSETYKCLLMQMIQDTSELESFTQFRIKYNSDYLYKAINKYFKDVIKTFKPLLGNSQYERVMKQMCLNIENYTLRKVNIGYYNKTNPNDTYVVIDPIISDEVNFIADSILTFITITEIIFLEKKINELDESNELYKIINNMIKEVDDLDIVFEKTYPVYNEFYQRYLGYGEEGAYRLAIFIIYNFLKKKEDIYKYNKIVEMDFDGNINDNINIWIQKMIEDNNYVDDVSPYLFNYINTLTSLNDEKYIDLLYEIDEYIETYNSSVKTAMISKDRDRYIKGDFSKEKNARAFKFNLSCVESGIDFELFLQNLLRELNYKVKTCGKSGDQGGDLLAKKGDITYIIQAKHYSNALGNTPVQEVIGAIRFYNANRGVVITNSRFTKGAKELAKANRIILIDGDQLENLIEKVFNNAEDYDFLEDYIDF